MLPLGAVGPLRFIRNKCGNDSGCNPLGRVTIASEEIFFFLNRAVRCDGLRGATVCQAIPKVNSPAPLILRPQRVTPAVHPLGPAPARRPLAAAEATVVVRQLLIGRASIYRIIFATGFVCQIVSSRLSG